MQSDPKIVRIESAVLEGKRPRSAGSNGRLGPHGDTVRTPFVRITTEDAATGFGMARISQEKAAALIGTPLIALFGPEYGGASEAGLPMEYPLWDLAGKRAGKPVYSLAAEIAGTVTSDTPSEPLRVRCYDTSLYFDDLHLTDDAAAADLLASEARYGYDRGHRAFKIKVGRGARHMPLEAGTRRDIVLIRAIRSAVGPDCPLMIDANNGYNLNLTKRVLEETADCRLLWIEEAFHEDIVLYQDLKAWMKDNNLSVLIADGEGEASPSLLNWVERGIVDILQYDFFYPGFTRWLALGRQINAWGAYAGPHHYGAYYGNYVTGHLARALPNFLYVEWDEVTMPGVATPGYAITDGWLSIPETPGFGLELEEEAFRNAVTQRGFTVS